MGFHKKNLGVALLLGLAFLVIAFILYSGDNSRKTATAL